MTRPTAVSVLLCLFVSLSDLCYAVPTTPSQIEAYTYDEYLKEFGKERGAYRSAEYEAHRALFGRRKKEILEHNSKPGVLYTMGINQFTDQSPEELKAYDNPWLSSSVWASETAVGLDRTDVQAQVKTMSVTAPPENFSWANHNPPVLNPARDQGSCGSCWAHVTAASIESHTAIKYGVLLNLSVEQVLSCRGEKKTSCASGNAMVAFGVLSFSLGMMTENDYPLVSTFSQSHDCREEELLPKVKFLACVEGCVKLTSRNANVILSAIAFHGPLATAVYSGDWHSYSGGILHSKSIGLIGHQVLLIGYGEVEIAGRKEYYWLVRNSWGPNWGENGNIRIVRAPPGYREVVNDVKLNARSSGHVQSLKLYGSFGVLTQLIYPIVCKPMDHRNGRIERLVAVPEDNKAGGSKSFQWVLVTLSGALGFIVMFASVCVLCSKPPSRLNNMAEF